MSWIAHDLHTLGMRPAKLARLPQCSSIVPFRDAPEALGWMYVVERATMHHAALCEHLARRYPDAPVAYLSEPFGASRLGELEQAFANEVTNDAARARVLAAAVRALGVQREWYECDVRTSSTDLVAVR